MIVTDIGFTGTQKGMTEYQLGQVKQLLAYYSALGAITLHHGDCMGADEEADAIAYILKYNIVIHPPSNPRKRAFCNHGRATILPEAPYHERNRDIVNSSDLLIACSDGPERLRSGTWYTINYFLKECPGGLIHILGRSEEETVEIFRTKLSSRDRVTPNG